MIHQTARARRTVKFVAVSLILGFFLQTLVAFGLAAVGPEEPAQFSSSGIPFTVVRDGSVFEVFGRSRGAVDMVYITFQRPARPSDRGTAYWLPEWTDFSAGSSAHMWTTQVFGWPWRSWLGAGEWNEYAVPPSATPTLLRSKWLPLHPLPTIPIPLNTLANSAFYGLLISPLRLVGIKARRAWRRRFRPGTCTHCGYTLAGLPAVAPCPECGGER